MNRNSLKASPVLLAIFALAVLCTPLATFAPSIQWVHSVRALILVFWLAALIGCLALYGWARQQRPAPFGPAAAVAMTIVFAGCIHILASYLPEISDHPLTLTWSETSRYYYASLFFSERIYGAAFPPTVLHPSRYLLQAAPFLIPNTSLWLHRAWQVCLWWTLPTAASLLLARRIAPPNTYQRWLLTGAFLLYLFIGPVYYHLTVPLIIILWGFSTCQDTPHRKWVSLAALLIASAWSGISRVNWFPAPGLLASALFLMEQPAPGASVSLRLNRSTWGYFLRPVGWTLLGTLVAFLAQIGYIAWSGNAAEQFASSFFSDLLWRRLLPNATYPLGLLPAAALISLPPFMILAGKLLEAKGDLSLLRRIHPIRLLALAAIAGVLLTGGLLVSVKIGGGSNLHNIDAYIALLGVIAAYFAFDRVVPDESGQPLETSPSPAVSRRGPRLFRAGLAALLAIVPTFALLPRGPVAPPPSEQATKDAILAISEAANYVHAQGQESLFISQRHLLTFGYLPGIPLAPDYERVFLMEAAMANDQTYLQRFYTDLEQQRYGLIVSEPLSKQLKDSSENFAAENNAWVKRISRQVLCYYEPVKTFNPTQVQLLAPRVAPDPDCR